MLRMLMFATVMILSGAALAEDGGGGDGGGDSDGGGAAEQSTESGPAPETEGDVAEEENCTGATGCQQKKPRVDFEAWDKSRKKLEKAADDAEKGSGKGSNIK